MGETNDNPLAEEGLEEGIVPEADALPDEETPPPTEEMLEKLLVEADRKTDESLERLRKSRAKLIEEMRGMRIDHDCFR